MNDNFSDNYLPDLDIVLLGSEDDEEEENCGTDTVQGTDVLPGQRGEPDQDVKCTWPLRQLTRLHVSISELCQCYQGLSTLYFYIVKIFVH